MRGALSGWRSRLNAKDMHQHEIRPQCGALRAFGTRRGTDGYESIWVVRRLETNALKKSTVGRKGANAGIKLVFKKV